MPELDLPFLAELSEHDRIHFRNLALIRPQIPSEGQLRLIEGLARSLASRRLLTLIARTPHWLVHGPILQALAENDCTPEPIRRDLEMAVSLFDMMRELDRAPSPEREEWAENAKALYGQLPADIKPIVKQQMKILAKQVNPSGFTQELPPLPSEIQDWEKLTAPPVDESGTKAAVRTSKAELLARAANTHNPDELVELLLCQDPEIRHVALHHPLASDELLAGVLPKSSSPALLEEVYCEARWYFRDTIRAAIYTSPACPQNLARKILRTQELTKLLGQGLHARDRIHEITCLFSQLEDSEYQFLTLWAKRHTPNMLRVVKIFYDRLQRKRAHQVNGLGFHPADGKWASLEERVFLANQTCQPDQLAASLRDPDLQVFMVVLENPGLTPTELLAAIPIMDEHRAERLAGHRTWSENPSVREALLHNVHITLGTALRLLKHLEVPRALIDVLRDPRIPHLEIKQQALETLKALYAAMTTQQRILALRGSGGELIRHLPQEVLKDEETLLLVVGDRQLDPSILLRLARNKLTPRSVLERIAVHPILMAHPAIMSELLLNPKTPRESAIRIWGLLSDSEQQVLLRSPHLPSTLRNLTSA